jgi:hypothetical protein
MGKRKLDEQSVARIQDMLEDPNRTITNIADAATVSRKSVAKIKRQHAAQIGGPFFGERLKQIAAQELLKICRDASYDPAPATTKVADDTSLPVIREGLLQKHRLQGYTQADKTSLMQMYEGDGKEFHGFWVCPRHESYDAAAVNDFLERVEKDPTKLAQFTSIFEYTQDVEGPPTKKQRAERMSKDGRRMGDGKRRHAIWEKWCEELRDRLKKSHAEASRLDRELVAAQAALDAFSNADPASNERGTRNTESFAQQHAAKAARAETLCETLRKRLESAEKALAAAKEDERQAIVMEKIFFENYDRIIAHSPYLTRCTGVEQKVTNRSLLSIILAMPKAGSQTIHADSLQRGCSLLTSAGKRQYLIVLLNGFRVMRSLERLLPQRAEALEYVRGRIAAEAPEGMCYWNDAAEHRVWNYLCCLQFQHERIGGLQAVRVPIEEGETLVLDNRTLHGGSRGEETNGFRFHMYAYDRDLLKREGEDRFDADNVVTFDLLDKQYGFYPVCRWAQTRAKAVFRA